MIQLDEETAKLFATINRTRDAYLDLDSKESIERTQNVVIRMESEPIDGPLKTFFCVYDSPIVDYTIVLQNVSDRICDAGPEKTLLLAEVNLKSESIEFSGTNGSLVFRFRAGEGKINCSHVISKGAVRHVASPLFDISYPIKALKTNEENKRA